MLGRISKNLFVKGMKPNRLTTLPFRGIKLHEYQAAQLLSKYDVPVPHVRFWRFHVMTRIGRSCLQSR